LSTVTINEPVLIVNGFSVSTLRQYSGFLADLLLLIDRRD
jgi:hypothetical protein